MIRPRHKSTLFPYTTLFRSYKAVNIQKLLDFIEAGKLTEDVKLSDLVETGIVYKNDLVKILGRSEEHTSELQSRGHLVCRLLLEKKKIEIYHINIMKTC